MSDGTGLGQLKSAIKCNFVDSTFTLWYLNNQASGIWGVFIILAISISAYKSEFPIHNICLGNHNSLPLWCLLGVRKVSFSLLIIIFEFYLEGTKCKTKEGGRKREDKIVYVFSFKWKQGFQVKLRFIEVKMNIQQN